MAGVGCRRKPPRSDQAQRRSSNISIKLAVASSHCHGGVASLLDSTCPVAEDTRLLTRSLASELVAVSANTKQVLVTSQDDLAVADGR